MEFTFCIQNNGLSPQPYNAPRCRFPQCPPVPPSQDEEEMPTYPPLVSPPASIATGRIGHRLCRSQA